MKLSKLLFGSLVLAVPFAACTNEDLMETLPSTPESVLEQAVSLGEDFSIVGQKSGAQTRFVWDTELNGAWETTDTVGGAWYAYTTDGGETGNYIDASRQYYSNHPFAYVKALADGAAEFKAPTNALAGKYVLYYPYDSKVTNVAEEIPVEFDQNPVMDCTSGKEMDHVNANFFAWCDAEFVVGGPQAGEFTLNQAGNLIVLNIGSTEGNIDRIQNKEISKVILESANKLVAKGKITPKAGLAYEKMVAEYAADGNVSTYILTPENATADYQVTAAGETGVTKKPFYISMLPADKSIAELTVRVILRDGRVYKKVLAKADNADLFGKLVKSAQKIELEVLLDTEDDDKGVYTAEQFNEALSNANAATNEITLAADIELPSLSFDKRGKAVTIKGSNLTIDGELNVTDGTLKIESNLTTKGDVTVSEYGSLEAISVAKMAAVKVDGKAALTGSTGVEIASVEATKASELSLKNVTTGKAIFGRSAGITLDGVTLKGTTTSTDADITIANSAVTNKSTFSATDGSINADAVALNNEGTMTLSTVTVSGNVGINNNAGATLDIAGDEATLSKVTNAEATSSPAKAAGIVNVELNEGETLTATIDNRGELNIIAGTVAEAAADALTLEEGSVVTIAEGAVLSLNTSTNGTNLKAGSKIIVVEDANISGGSLGGNVSVAAQVNAVGELDKKEITGLTELILNVEGLEITQSNFPTDKIVTLKKSIKITSASGTITMTKALNVEGDVTITADAAQTIELAATPIENTINGKLTVGKNVTLQGNASGSTIVLVDGSTVKEGTDGDYVPTNIKYELQ